MLACDRAVADDDVADVVPVVVADDDVVADVVPVVAADDDVHTGR